MSSLLEFHAVREAISKLRSARARLNEVPNGKGPVSDAIRATQEDLGEAEKWLDGLEDRMSLDRT